ncbi:MAG: hypothetical protein PHV77_05605 [Candidatus Omnitrophica bacterium]|nr:hypothetical protein [Candidatus Omnitrophota bacterium]
MIIKRTASLPDEVFSFCIWGKRNIRQGPRRNGSPCLRPFALSVPSPEALSRLLMAC